MSTTESSPSVVEKPRDTVYEVGHAVTPLSEPYPLSDDAAPAPRTNLGTYRALRTAIAVLSGIIALLSLAGLILGAFIAANASKYSGYDRIKAEKEASGGDQSMEGEHFTRSLFSLCYALTTIFSIYCFVVMVVCFILTLARSHRVLAPGCCPSACLAVTVMIGVALTIGEIAIYFSVPPEGLDSLGALPVVRVVLLVAYFVLVVVCACMFDDDNADYFYQ